MDNPAPGAYPLTDYSSSDWDESPHSYDPELGEQSTTRRPFLDWRDCCPPPWADPALNVVPNAFGPQWTRYVLPALTWWANVFGPTPFPAAEMTNISPRVWRTAAITVGAVTMQASLSFLASGQATLLVLCSVFGPLIRARLFTINPPVDPAGPLVFRVSESPSPELEPSPVITVRGVGDVHFVVAPCLLLATEDGFFLIAE